MKNEDYIFTSARLGFRPWTPEDVDEFAKLNADEEVMRYFPKTLSRQEVVELIEQLTLHYKEHKFTYFATEILATKEFIGMIGLAAQTYETVFTPAIDMGWRLKKKAWGKGYATEGAKRCLEYAFNTLNLDKIIAVCTAQNTPSEKVMQKIGMLKKGSFDHPKLMDLPEYKKHLCYEIRRSE